MVLKTKGAVGGVQIHKGTLGRPQIGSNSVAMLRLQLNRFVAVKYLCTLSKFLIFIFKLREGSPYNNNCNERLLYCAIVLRSSMRCWW